MNAHHVAARRAKAILLADVAVDLDVDADGMADARTQQRIAVAARGPFPSSDTWAAAIAFRGTMCWHHLDRDVCASPDDRTGPHYRWRS